MKKSGYTSFAMVIFVLTYPNWIPVYRPDFLHGTAEDMVWISCLSFALSILSFGFADVKNALKASCACFSFKSEILFPHRTVDVLYGIIVHTYMSGVIFALIILVQILQSAGRVEIDELCFCVSFALADVFYSMVVSECFIRPVRNQVLTRLAQTALIDAEGTKGV